LDKNTKINELDITDEFEMAESNESIDKIAQKLKKLYEEHDHGLVLVTQGDEVIGYITGKEILDSIAAGREPSKMNAGEIINNDFVEVLEDETMGNIMPIISQSYPNAIVVIDSNRRCVGFFSKNDYKDAMAAMGIYDKKQQPKTSDDWRTKGIALSAVGKRLEALKCYERSIKSSPDQEKAWSNLAKRLDRINRHKDAIMCLDKVVTVNPDNDEALAERGDIYAKENTENLAIQSFKMALSINPDNVKAQISLGLEQAKLGEIDEAIKSLDKAQEMKGETSDLWFKKGNVYEKGKKYEEAVECYDHAIGMDDKFEDAWFNKGVALSALDKNPETLECLNKILEINPDNKSAKEAIDYYKENESFNFF
jgi:tetratricopeptide (TPR) repeat protein